MDCIGTYCNLVKNMMTSNTEEPSGALWQGSNSKIENYGFFGCCGFVLKGITVIFGMSMQIAIVQTMVWYFHKNYSYLVSMHVQLVFLKKLKMAKCSPNPKKPQIGIWTQLNMLYHNPTGSFKFCNFSIVYVPFIV